MPDPQHKLVKVDDSIIHFPGDMPDDDVAAIIKKFTSSPDYKKQTHTKSQMPSGIATEESEHKRLTGNVPTVTPDWNTVRKAVYKATEPTLPNQNTTPVNNTVKANVDAAWNAGANAANVGGNIAKRAGRVIFGAVEMPIQVLSILKNLSSSDDKVSQQAETNLLNLHPGAQIADRLKEAVTDWRKSKSLATENALGDVLGFFLLDKAGKVLPEEKIKQLNAEGVVLPPEAQPKTVPAKAGPTTIEGQFEKVPPKGFQPVQAAAKITKNEPPKLADVKAEAGKLSPVKVTPDQLSAPITAREAHSLFQKKAEAAGIKTKGAYLDAMESNYLPIQERLPAQVAPNGWSVEPSIRFSNHSPANFRPTFANWQGGTRAEFEKWADSTIQDIEDLRSGNLKAYLEREDARRYAALQKSADWWRAKGDEPAAQRIERDIEKQKRKTITLPELKAKAAAVQAYKPAPQGEVLPPQGIEGLLSPDKRVQDDARATAKRKLTDLGFSESDYPAGGPQAPKTIEGEKPEVAPKTEQTTKYKFGNTQADIPQDSEAGQALATARTKIDKNDLMPSTNTADGSGLEENSHITVRYGIDGEDTAGIKAYLEKQAPFEATLGKTTAFPPSEHSDGGAPIVVNIESPELHRMENEIDAHGNFTERSFPEYRPHVTLAYVKPEAAQKYVGMSDTEGKKFTVNSVSISNKDGSIEEVPLKGTPAVKPVDAAMNLKYNAADQSQPFYLKSEKLLAEKMKGPMPASDIQKMLLANGVKEEEMKYTGLDDFLKEKGNEKVTPQEINEFNATHDLQVREVIHGDNPRTGNLDDEIRELSNWPRDPQTAKNPADQRRLNDLLRLWDDAEKYEGPVKYGNWQMPGGTNYRELLITMPNEYDDSADIAKMDALSAKLDEIGEPTKDPERWKQLTDELNIVADKRDTAWKKARGSNFRSNHWDELNPVVHVRFNDRVGPNGEHLLHLEEAQSDLHQQGRKYRYADPKKPFAVTGAEGQFATREEAEQAAKANNVPTSFVRDERVERPNGVLPDLPFKKTWADLVLKRMIKFAVDKGYDGLTWTPGEEQADRYDLSKQVSRITYAPADGTLRGYDLNGGQVITENAEPEELENYIGKDAAQKLIEKAEQYKQAKEDAYNGKPFEVEHNGKVHTVTVVPDRITHQGSVLEAFMVTDGTNRWYEPARNIPPLPELKGVDLKVGGQGMKGFYDKIVPDALNKIAKKFGTKVGQIKVEGASEVHNAPTITELHGYFTIFNPEDPHDEPLGEFDTREEAEAFLSTLHKPSYKKSIEVPYLPITPQMRSGVQATPFALFKQVYKSPPASEVQISTAWRQLGDIKNELAKTPPPPDPDVNTATPEEIEKWKADYKQWAETAHPWLERYKQASQNIEDLKNRGIGEIRLLPDKSRVLYLNRAGLNTLYHGMAGEARPEYTLSGVSLTPHDVKAIIGNLTILKPPLHQELTEMMLRGMDKKGVTVSVIPRKGESMREALSTLREELNHGWQNTVADQMGNHLSPDKFAELNEVMPAGMQDHLTRNYPEITNDGSELMNRRRVREASAKMLSEAPQKLGLTEDEAAAYLFQYFHALEEQHGEKALDNLLHITTLGRSIKRDYFRALGRNSGSEADQRTLGRVQEGGRQGDQGNPEEAGRRVPEGAGVAAKLEPAMKQVKTPDTGLFKSGDIDYWTRYAAAHDFKTEAEARDWVRDKLEYFDRQTWAEVFGKEGPEKIKAKTEAMPIYKEKGKFKIGQKPGAGPARTERIGTENPEGKVPSVDWYKRDNQDSGRISDEQLLEDYNEGKPALVYRSYIDANDMPEPVLAEDEDRDEDEDPESLYDWESLRMTGDRRAAPPMKVKITRQGQVVILDGNHRLKLWQERGYTSFPAWVIDERKGKISGLSEEEEDKLAAIKRAAAKLKTPAAAKQVTVRDPEGYVHTFPDEASAAKFRAAAGIK